MKTSKLRCVAQVAVPLAFIALMPVGAKLVGAAIDAENYILACLAMPLPIIGLLGFYGSVIIMADGPK